MRLFEFLAGPNPGEIPKAMRSACSETRKYGEEKSKGKQSHYKVIIKPSSVIKKPGFRHIRVTYSALQSALQEHQHHQVCLARVKTSITVNVISKHTDQRDKFGGFLLVFLYRGSYKGLSKGKSHNHRLSGWL